jgi:hypothetical protein
MTTRVLEYGCASEHYGGYGNVQAAIEKIGLADRLWNALVDIERYNLMEFRRLTSDLTLEAQLKAKDDGIGALSARIQLQKAQERKKSIKVDPALSEAIRVLKDERKPIYESLRLARLRMKRNNASTLEMLKQDINRRYDAVMDEASNGLNHCIRNPLLKSFKTALATGRKRVTAIVKRKLKAGRKVTGFEGLPRFRGTNGTGIVTVPFTKGLPVGKAQVWDDAVGKFQIGAPDPTYNARTLNRGKNQSQFGGCRRELRLCRLAIATDVNRKPIWFTLPVIFHRPIPETADIRNVTARRELIAGKASWTLFITIRVDKPEKTSTTLSCAVNIGWRKRDDGNIRAAYLVDEEGHQEELLFPASDMEQYRKVDELQGIIRGRFNAIRDVLAAWFQSVMANGSGNPDVIRVPRTVLDACSTHGAFSIHQWKSPKDLVRLMWVWKNNRFRGDEQIWNQLIYWYHGDATGKMHHQVWKGRLTWSQVRKSAALKPDVWNGHEHLYLWWKHLWDQLRRRRRERYRVFAASLARKYGTIFIEDFDLRSVIETPSPEWDRVNDRLARLQRSRVAPGILREAIKNVCLREGINLVAINPRGISRKCPKCGTFVDFDAARRLTCRCEGCGSVFDQDYVAAQNMLNSGLYGATS